MHNNKPIFLLTLFHSVHLSRGFLFGLGHFSKKGVQSHGIDVSVFLFVCVTVCLPPLYPPKPVPLGIY